MTERILITKIEKRKDGKIDLIGRGHQWADILLFDASDLIDIGIDPAGLTIGQETVCRFWAIYALSERLNQKGNPYKDIVSLEPIDKPATTTSTDSTALLMELREIKTILARLLAIQSPPESPPPAAQQPEPPPAVDPPPPAAQQPEPPAQQTSEQARTAFYAQAGPAIAARSVDAVTVNNLATQGYTGSWRQVLKQFEALIA